MKVYYYVGLDIHKKTVSYGCATKVVSMLQVIVVIPRSRRSPVIPDSIAAR